jgi:hypothetical protein
MARSNVYFILLLICLHFVISTHISLSSKKGKDKDDKKDKKDKDDKGKDKDKEKDKEKDKVKGKEKEKDKDKGKDKVKGKDTSKEDKKTQKQNEKEEKQREKDAKKAEKEAKKALKEQEKANKKSSKKGKDNNEDEEDEDEDEEDEEDIPKSPSKNPQPTIRANLSSDPLFIFASSFITNLGGNAGNALLSCQDTFKPTSVSSLEKDFEDLNKAFAKMSNLNGICSVKSQALQYLTTRVAKSFLQTNSKEEKFLDFLGDMIGGVTKGISNIFGGDSKKAPSQPKEPKEQKPKELSPEDKIISSVPQNSQNALKQAKEAFIAFQSALKDITSDKTFLGLLDSLKCTVNSKGLPGGAVQKTIDIKNNMWELSPMYNKNYQSKMADFFLNLICDNGLSQASANLQKAFQSKDINSRWQNLGVFLSSLP